MFVKNLITLGQTVAADLPVASVGTGIPENATRDGVAEFAGDLG